MVGGTPSLLRRLVHGIGRLAQRHARREVEADGDRRELALMADRQRLDRLGRPLGEGRERHLAAGRRRLQEDPVERADVALHRRQHLHDHVIARELREVLARSGAGRRRRTACRRSSAPSGRSARPRRDRPSSVSVVPEVCWSEATSRSCGRVLQLLQDLGRPLVQLADIGSLQRVLVLRARGAAADAHVLRGLQEELRALDLLRLGAAAAR